jgi:hypothetical protein
MQQRTEQMNKYRSSFVEMENCFLVAFSRFSSETILSSFRGDDE